MTYQAIEINPILNPKEDLLLAMRSIRLLQVQGDSSCDDLILALKKQTTKHLREKQNGNR